VIRSRLESQGDGGGQAEINISPLIDCVFILLIFFIVTTVFVDETGVEVQKPEAASSLDLEKESLFIAITADNRIYYAGKEIDVPAVGAVVKRQMSKKEVPVIVLADRTADHGVFSQVYGEAKAAGAKKVNFSTQN